MRGPDAFKQYARRLVVGVLRHQFAAKGFGEQGGREAVDLSTRGDVAGFEAVGVGKQRVDPPYDLCLFSD